jgi:ubiquinone/menaquinone biosynthesis C-methylase UbiE
MTAYDRMAGEFDRRRPLPRAVPEMIRDAVLAELPARPALLDIGCGTGRIGWPFAAAGDAYTGVDLSPGMLHAFTNRDLPRPPRLALADGARLPFPDAAFDGVLLVQVLSAAHGWRALLDEVRRVLAPGGALFVGQSKAPDDGLDARMKQRMAEILAVMGEHPYERKPKEDAFGWLARHTARVTRIVAQWPMRRTPRAFIERHCTGSRFSALPEPVRTAATAQIGEWARTTIGSLDALSAEVQTFELLIHRFHEKATP